MENITPSNNSRISSLLTEPDSGKFQYQNELSKGGTSPAVGNILSEGGDGFFEYLSWIGLLKEPNLMVLSSGHNYYYDHNDLIGIKTLINMKPMNRVKHLDSFLNIMHRILQPKAYFVGCFRNCTQNMGSVRNQDCGRFPGSFMNVFNGSAERSLSKRGLTKLLEEHGFKVIDITDINGLTYFWAQNTRIPGE